MNAFRFVFMLLICTVACAAQAQKSSAPYTFDVPAGWTAMSLGGDGTIVTSGDAYVRIVKVPGGGKDEQLVKRVIDQVGAQWTQFKQDERGQAKLAGSDGIYLFLSGVNPKGVEATMRIVAAPVGDDAYMLIMSAPKQEFLPLREAFKQIEHTFALSSGALSSGSPQPAPGEDLPARPTGTGLKVVDEAGGGHILFSPLTGGVASGVDRLSIRLSIRARSAAISMRHRICSSVVTSKDRNLTISVFHASLHGSPVAGLMTAAYDPAGNSHFAVVYDAPDHLKTSLTADDASCTRAGAGCDRALPDRRAPALRSTSPNSPPPPITFALTREQYLGRRRNALGIASGAIPRTCRATAPASRAAPTVPT